MKTPREGRNNPNRTAPDHHKKCQFCKKLYPQTVSQSVVTCLLHKFNFFHFVYRFPDGYDTNPDNTEDTKIMSKIFNPWNEQERKNLRDFLKTALEPVFVDKNPLVFTRVFFEDNGYDILKSFGQLSEYCEQYRKNINDDKMVMKSMW